MRFIKQLVYSSVYLAIILAILVAFYFFAIRPTPTCFDDSQNGDETGIDCGGGCISCDVKYLKPLVLSPASLYEADRAFSAASEIVNPNDKFGAKNFDYQVNFYDSAGTVLKTVEGKSFIYPGESKYIIEAGVRTPTGVPVKAEIAIKDGSVVWESPKEFFQPPTDLKEVMTALEVEQAVVSGTISNLNNYVISRLVVSAFVFNNLGQKLGVSKTEMRDVGPFRAEMFRLFVPVKKDLVESVDITRSKVIVEAFK